MAQQQTFDVVIVGGGLAGAALALSLAPLSLRVALVEGRTLDGARPPLEESVLDYDPRVSALTEASRQLLETLQVWADIAEQRACAYGEMQVWDAEGTGRIHFSAAEVQRPALGHIVENRLITVALIQRLEETGVAMISGTAVQGLSREGDVNHLQLADGRSLQAPLIVAADGAQSRLRDWAGFVTREWDYHHHAIACTVECELPHRATAWQRFMPEGPLAFLPLADAAGQQRYCSIVWSAQPALAESLMAMEEVEFCSALGQAFEHQLGAVLACGKRFSFPLRQRHAREYARAGVVLVGDAAHSIHPLAGQGINLGFADVQVLAEQACPAAGALHCRCVSVGPLSAPPQGRQSGDDGRHGGLPTPF